MIEAIFYFQCAIGVILVALGLYYKSYPFFVAAGAVFIITALMLAGEGISYPTGWQGEMNKDTYDFNVGTSYTVLTTGTSWSVNLWFYVLLAFGLVWWVVAIALGVSIRENRFLKK